MICHECANQRHCSCLYPDSCCCQHRVPASQPCVDDIHESAKDCCPQGPGACEVC